MVVRVFLALLLVQVSTGQEYQQSPGERTHDEQASNVGHNSASFSSQVVRPADEDMQCLNKASQGCKAIKDRINCLSSVDASGTGTVKDVQMDGEPCVWCGGGLCTSESDALCAPYDYLAKGEGVLYTTLHAMPSYMTVATCKANTNSDFDNLQCLTSQVQGCNSIQDEDTCLSSVDGRPYEYIAGLKAKGQPCVWCGGGVCSSLNSNKCEPYDFVINGASHAFETFHGVGVYKAAACQGGQPASHVLNSGFSTHGTSWQVPCGSGPPQVWTKIGRVCGECKVYVSKIKELYSSCTEYCAGQPVPLSCVAAHTVQPYSCDTIGELGCDYKFKDDENAECTCEGGEHEHEQAAPAAPAAPAQTFASPSCSANPGCAQLSLSGDCCPNAAGTVLGCCNEAAGAAASTEQVQVAAAAAAHEAAETAQDENKSPTEQAQAAAAAASDIAADGGANVALAAGLGAGMAAGLSPEESAAAISAQDSATDTVVAAAAAASAAGTAAGLTDQQADAAATQVGQAAGQAAGLSADAAAETAAQAATMADDAKETIGETVSEASAPASAAPAPPAPTGMLQNTGLDCWEPCNQKTGLCDYCGRGNACCNRNSANPPTECKNITSFVTWHHECVTPLHQVDTPAQHAFEDPTAAGATAASQAASTGQSTEEQTAAAAVSAGQVATQEGMGTFQSTQAATEAATDAASNAGLDDHAAKTAGAAAASAAAASGFSDDAAKTAGAAAASAAAASGVSDDDMVVANSGGGTAALDVQTDTSAAETKSTDPSDTFTSWQWVLVILAVLAICVAGAAGYYLSGQGQREVKTLRDTEVVRPAPAAESKDLEYQAPLVTAAAAPVMYQQVATMPARQVAGQGMMGTRFAFNAMNAFDAADTNHNNFLSREEFSAGVASGIIR